MFNLKIFFNFDNITSNFFQTLYFIIKKKKRFQSEKLKKVIILLSVFIK